MTHGCLIIMSYKIKCIDARVCTVTYRCKGLARTNRQRKEFTTQIFRLFTQSDVDVGSRYVDRYMRIFKKPEARMMMGRL